MHGDRTDRGPLAFTVLDDHRKPVFGGLRHQ